MDFDIREGGLDDAGVIALLTIHVTKARAATALCSAHALDVSGLRAADIRFWTAWDDGGVLGTIALKRLSPSHGEVKSMHTAESARRRGVASSLLRHVIQTAQADGVDRLSLETGSSAYFLPAHALYAKHGFVECGPFGDYVLDPNSIFMSMQLRG